MKYALVYTNYKINFKALAATGEEVGTATLQIRTCRQMDIQRKQRGLQRLCVEYARLIGIPCSYAEITNLEETIDTEGDKTNE